jgi:hypothetical protein
MFSKFTIKAGVACCAIAAFAAWLGVWAPLAFAGVVFFFAEKDSRINDNYTVKDAFIRYQLAAAFAVIPPDGSWIVWGIGTACALGLLFWVTQILYSIKFDPQEPKSWLFISCIALSLGLPLLGLGLVQYLLATDRSVVSGLAIIGLLTWLGWWLAPHSYVAPDEPAKPVKLGPWGPYRGVDRTV